MTKTRNTRDQWRERAKHLSAFVTPGELAAAGRVLQRWRYLVANVPHRALSAAAHEGLAKGGTVHTAVAAHYRAPSGCLTLGGSCGTGKSVGAATEAYHMEGSVLWLDASKVGTAQPSEIQRWLSQIVDFGLVVLDDLGAGMSVGDWSAAKISSIVAAILDRPGPSVMPTNLDRGALVALLDGPHPGRVSDRLDMSPNVWINVVGKSNRSTAKPPPSIDVLPEREAQAQALIAAEHVLTLAAHGDRVCGEDEDIGDMDPSAVPARSMESARRALGYADWHTVDREIEEAKGQRRETMKLIGEQVDKMRVVDGDQ